MSSLNSPRNDENSWDKLPFIGIYTTLRAGGTAGD